MRRDPMPWLLLLLLTVLGGVAWFTRYPDSPALVRLTELQAIGPVAQRFRELYRPAPPPAAEPQPEVVAVGGEEVSRPATVEVVARPVAQEWVRAGTELRAAPEPGSEVVATVETIRRMTVVEQRGDWRLISNVGLQGTLTRGWARAGDLGEPSAEELWQPEPVLPLAAAEPAEEALALARELMGDDVRELSCGPFLLLTDAAGPVVERCSGLAGPLDRLYAERTGLEPVGEPAEAILLFRSHGAYLIFRNRLSPQSRRHAFASPARGIVALAAGGRPPAQLQATLVHELVHLMNRRFLGPALPSWLDEGLAEELALSRIEPDGTLVPGRLGRWELGPARISLVGGGEVERETLRRALERDALPTLEELVGLDRAGFQVEGRFQLNYSLSAFWVRYLLSDEAPEGGAGFRAFLAAVAAGQPLGEELLLSRLGAGWPELEAGFRRWLDSGA